MWGRFLGKFPDSPYTSCWLEPLFVLALSLLTAGQGMKRAGSRGTKTPSRRCSPWPLVPSTPGCTHDAGPT